MATIQGPTPVHHPKMHPPRPPIELRKSSMARQRSVCLGFFLAANSSPRLPGSLYSFLEAC